MKSTRDIQRTRLAVKANTHGANRTDRKVEDILARAKRDIMREQAEYAGEHVHVLRLALNEAEALAWNSGVPQLVFPVLAMEKAQAALAWHRRQRAVRRAGLEIAFAE